MPIRIYLPTPTSAKSWECRYEIDWPKGTRRGVAGGFDSVQAINIAMQKVGTELYASPIHEAGLLVFDEIGNGYGFPVPKPLRERLVGDDAKYDGNA